MGNEIQQTRSADFRMAFEPRDPSQARTLAKIAVASRFFAVKSEEEALIIMMTGRELGLTAMQALRGICICQGKPVLYSDTMVAAIMMSGLAEHWQILESTVALCTIETKRKGAIGPVRKTWTIEDAKRAGLANKDVWRSYPDEMLRHRCAAALGRSVYSDVLLGCYVHGELEDEPARAVVVSVSSPSSIAADDSVPELPESTSAATALDTLRFDLAEVEGGTLLQVARVWNRHSQAIYAEAEGDAGYLYKGQSAALGTTKTGCTINQLNEHTAALEMRGRVPGDDTYAKVMDLLEAAESAEKIVEIWRANRGDLELRTEEIRSLLRKLATRRVQELMPGMSDAKQAANWLKKSLSQEPATPPGGGAPKPEVPLVSDETDPERAAIEGEGDGPSAEAQEPAPASEAKQLPLTFLKQKLAEATDPTHIYNTLIKYGPGQVSENEGVQATAERFHALGGDLMAACTAVREEIRRRGGWKARKAA